MSIVRFSPFEQMDSLRRQIDRAFAEIDEVNPDSYSTWTPKIELLDDGDTLMLRMQLAGINAKEIDIQVTQYYYYYY